MTPGTAPSPALALAGGAELQLRIALLPPISRGAHLDGPPLHAQRLIELWQVADGDNVPLAQAFRFVDKETVAGTILRTLYLSDTEYPDGGHHWHFPGIGDLLPELREAAWQLMLDGALEVKGIKGVRGNRHRAILPAELPRLTPDWGLSRLTRGARRDEFIDVRVRRPPAEPIKKAWRGEKPSRENLREAMRSIAKDYPADVHPPEPEIWDALKKRLGHAVTRAQARDALKDHALKGRRGRRWSKSPS
jgi:hypothetical protein